MLTDIALISGLLVIAQLLRARLPWLSRYLIPSSMIAGILALILGPGGYDWLPFSRAVNGAANLTGYPGVLITLLFATLMLGHRPRGGWRSATRGASQSFLFNMASELMQYGLTICIGVALLALVFVDLRAEFMVLLPAGFAGGHGTAALFAEAMPQWDAARSVGFTFATVGILAAVFGGLVLVNIARRRGWCAHETATEADRAAESAAFLAPDRQSSLGRATVNPIALEPLAWHFAIVLAVYGAAMAVLPALRNWLPTTVVLPAFGIAMLTGWVLQTLLNLARVGQYVDALIVGRIGALMSDFLVAFGIASIDVQIVVDYALPLIVYCLLGLAICVGWLLLVTPRVFGKNWFESGIFTYGWNTGTIAFGVALLRIVDNRSESRVLSDYGIAFIAIGPLEALLYSIVIASVAGGYLLTLGVLLVLIAATMIALAVWRARTAS